MMRTIVSILLQQIRFLNFHSDKLHMFVLDVKCFIQINASLMIFAEILCKINTF